MQKPLGRQLIKKNDRDDESRNMVLKIIIDNDECLVCEACVEICPSVFGFDQATGTAFVIEGADQDDDCVDEAIAACPAECINREE